MKFKLKFEADRYIDPNEKLWNQEIYFLEIEQKLRILHFIKCYQDN